MVRFDLPDQCEEKVLKENSTLRICYEMGMDNELHEVYKLIGNGKLQIDYSKYDFPNDIWIILPPLEVTIKTVTLVPIVIFGVIGNIMLLSTIFRNRSLRTPTNLLIANMATADLASLLICPCMFMFHDFFQNYLLGTIGCKSEGFLLGSLLITSVISLCAVSYDRLTAIALPLETRLSVRGAKVVIAFSWCAGLVIAYPLSHFRTYVERQWRNFLETFCMENVQILPIYWHIIIAAMVWIPLAVMIVCYSALFWKLDQYERRNLKRRENPISVSYKKKVAKMLFIVLITFIMLRLPFTMLVFIRNKMLQQSVMNQFSGFFHCLWYIAHYMIFLNAALNPMIYGMTNDNFRRAYSQTRCCGGKLQKESRPFGQDMEIKSRDLETNGWHLSSMNASESSGDYSYHM